MHAKAAILSSAAISLSSLRIPIELRRTRPQAIDHLVSESRGRLASPHFDPLMANRVQCMPKILIVHGAGMNMRGKVQTEIFGPMTLPEYDERIRGYAAELGVEVEIFHSNIEGEVVNKLYEANDKGCDAALFNLAGFSSGYPGLVA